VCSNVQRRLAEISQAIDELAADTQRAAATGRARAGKPALTTPGPADTPAADARATAARLAELWAMLADADPQIGRKLRHYQD
jgi:hypothetical protein